MLQFNGTELSNIIQVAPVSINNGTVTYSKRGGEYVATARKKNISIALLNPDNALRKEDLNKLISWIGNGDGKLIAYDEPNAYLNGEFSSIPDVAWGKPGIAFPLTFTCSYDPYYHSTTEKNRYITSSYTVEKHHADWRIEQTISIALTNPTWSCNGATLTLTEVPVGNLVIDSRLQTITVNGTNIMENLVFGSEFPYLSTGTHSFTTSNGAGGTLYTREAWL